MMSRRNVISICIVIVVIIILVIVLVSKGSTNDKAYDNNADSGGHYDVTEDNNSSVYKDDNNDKEQTTDPQYRQTGQDEVVSPSKEEDNQKYIIRDIGDGVVIYKCVIVDDKESEEFYDYALINPQDCSKAVAESLKRGIELYGERELYGFLQAYSS